VTIYAARIRTAVRELLEGTIGTTRAVTSGVFRYGVFDGQPLQAQQAKTAITTYTHRFDVLIKSLSRHAATPSSNNASHRIARCAVEIPIWSHLKSTAQESERAEQREKIENDCDLAMQALCYRNNLAATSAAAATGIISGMLLGADGSGYPTWTVVDENWQRHMLRSVIRASAALVITQASV
jgi:hypothetical protein